MCVFVLSSTNHGDYWCYSDTNTNASDGPPVLGEGVEVRGNGGVNHSISPQHREVAYEVETDEVGGCQERQQPDRPSPGVLLLDNLERLLDVAL